MLKLFLTWASVKTAHLNSTKLVNTMSNLYARAVIVTKHLSPSTHRGTRIKVQAAFKSKTYPYPYAQDGAEAHIAVFKQFCEEFNVDWADTFTVGADNNNYYFTPVTSDNTVGVK